VRSAVATPLHRSTAPPLAVRYTFRTVKRFAFTLLLSVLVVNLCPAEETSFRHIKIPNLKGKESRAVLIFSDTDKAVEVRPAKGALVTVAYGQIDKCLYSYTTELTIGLTEAKNHWLEIDYHDQDAHKVLVLQMDKHEYVRILDALKTHTGIDAEILGNADKRHEKIWHTR
jgi:hypothetical protein